MKTLLVSIVSTLGALVSATATAGCLMFWFDEPTMPKAMLEK